MQFFQTILNSIYSPQFYKKDIPAKSMGSSFGYYFLLSLLLTTVSVIGLILPVSQGMQELTGKIVPELVDKYPKDLEVRIKNGQVSTNAKEPYMIPLPNGTDPKYKNLLVIDTKSEFSFDKFDTYKTLAVLTKDHIYYQDTDQEEIRGTDLSDIKDFTLNKTIIQNFVRQISPLFSLLTPLILFFAFLGIYLVFTLRLIHIALLALILFLLMKMIKPALTYSNAFKTVLFAITLGLILETLFAVTRSVFHLDGFPYMVTLLTLGVAILNYKSNK